MLRAKQVYPDETRKTSRTSKRSQPQRCGVSRWRVIEEAKEKVPVMDLAERLCGGKLRRVGKERVSRCLLPDHEDKTPSFTINLEKNVFFCHGCLRGGDVITLAQRVWGIDRADVAAAEILLTFGYEIPKRPDSWFRKQDRQASVRDAIEQARVAAAQRRIYRAYKREFLADLDGQEVAEEKRLLWWLAGRLAEDLVGLNYQVR